MAGGGVGARQRASRQLDGREAQRLGRKRDRSRPHQLQAGQLGLPPGEQVEADLGAEARLGDTHARIAEDVGDAVAQRSAPEGAEPRAGVDRAAPSVREAHALQLRERLEELLCELLEGRGPGVESGVDAVAVVVDRVVPAPQQAPVLARAVVVELVARVRESRPVVQPIASRCPLLSGSVMSA